MSFALFFLFAIVFLAVSAITHGTALAFKKKRGGPLRARPLQITLPLSQKDIAEGESLPEDWPEWNYPRAGNVFEKMRHWAEDHTKVTSSHGAAHGWDGTRAVALLALGPGDPRVWAALSRSAKSLADHAAEMSVSLGDMREFRLRAAASVAMGALEGFDEVERAAAKGAGDGPPPIAAGEREFARKTLDRINAAVPAGRRAAFAPRAARSLAEALYPVDGPFLGRAGQKPVGELFPSAPELRGALARAEGPGGPGPGSREALSLKSRLGLELWDSGGATAAREAAELLTEASSGLDSLLGPENPEALAAKERLARRLAGLPGYGKIMPHPLRIPADPDLVAARALFREIKKLAPRGVAGRPIRKRAEMGALAAGVGREVSPAARDAVEEAICDFMTQHFKATMAGNGGCFEYCDYGDDEGASRLGFDLDTVSVRAGLGDMDAEAHGFALARRRYVLGGRHPETACSLALTMVPSEIHEGDFAYWILAVEALEGRGGRYASQEAELKVRIGRFFLSEGDYDLAAVVLAEADKLYLDSWGERCQERLECAALLAQALRESGDATGAEKISRSLLALLDGAPPRRDPEPTLPSDALILASALAGTAAAMFSRGEREEASRLMKRAMEGRAGEGGDSVLGTYVDTLARSMKASL
ncbi:MAG: hypothetical protein LBO66_03370 [Deltaproteobacteria bacterium]|jgi:tetratricopeptide (TPR) repeat protein|nr:hypothetical protein [Deltaproteobacteria bacterium]